LSDSAGEASVIVARVTLPPGLRAPAIVQIGRWIVQPLTLLEQCQRRFGNVFTFSAPGGVSFVIVGDPELIRQVLTADSDTLLAGAGNATVLEPMLGKHSLLTLDGAEHLRQRRLLLPAFHGERMQGWVATMREITEASIDAWPMHRPFALHSMMQSITLDVILKTVFGVSSADKTNKLRQTLVEFLEIAANPWLLFPGLIGLDPFKIPWLRITRLKGDVDDALYRTIADARRHPPGGTDVLSMMLAARDESGEPMTDVELRDELVTLLLAGHETTATSLAWTFDQLLAHPACFRRLREEIAAGRDEYIDAVIRETLRVRPIVPLVGRVVAKPFKLGRWDLPIGTHIAPSIYLAGRTPGAYPEPDQFKPERWLGVKPDPYTWLPFGGGVRRCIGMAFAQLEMKVVLQTIIPRVDLHLSDGPARVVRRGITLAPTGGTRVVVDARRGRPPRMGGDSGSRMIT
jgi:cytochrome P450 family 135